MLGERLFCREYECTKIVISWINQLRNQDGLNAI